MNQQCRCDECDCDIINTSDEPFAADLCPWCENGAHGSVPRGGNVPRLNTDQKGVPA